MPKVLQILVETATALIDMISNNEHRNTFEYNSSMLKLHTILSVMLHHTEGCGGIDSKCYTASSICLCAIQNDLDNEQTLQMLHDLAKTWVSHLLFVCKQ
jgi:hypothetical protein